MLLSLSLAASGIAMAIMHDGNHGGFSRYRSLNRLASFTLDLLGSSSALWCIKHNKAHHNRPNWMKHDSDIEQEPFARLAPHQQWHQHRPPQTSNPPEACTWGRAVGHPAAASVVLVGRDRG